jgi:hypothetical protein
MTDVEKADQICDRILQSLREDKASIKERMEEVSINGRVELLYNYKKALVNKEEELDFMQKTRKLMQDIKIDDSSENGEEENISKRALEIAEKFKIPVDDIEGTGVGGKVLVRDMNAIIELLEGDKKLSIKKAIQQYNASK